MSIEIAIAGPAKTGTPNLGMEVEGQLKGRPQCRSSICTRMKKPKVLFILISSVCLSLAGLAGQEIPSAHGFVRVFEERLWSPEL
ncbi:MAG TPA: hypothetical protein VLQ90_05375 [Pyrinomonadaceae bacterium]|nr:hypothetical protein [Pyrinomonadaceae bacterium]